MKKSLILIVLFNLLFGVGFSQVSYDLSGQEIEEILQETLYLPVTTKNLNSFSCYFEEKGCYLVDDSLTDKNLKLKNKFGQNVTTVSWASLPVFVGKFLQIQKFRISEDRNKCYLQLMYNSPSVCGLEADSIAISVLYDVTFKKNGDDWQIWWGNIKEIHNYQMENLKMIQMPIAPPERERSACEKEAMMK